MSRKCPHCKEEIIEKPISKLPLYVDHEWEFLGLKLKKKFNKEAFRWQNLNLKNLIIGDWMNLMIILSILFVAWAYSHDTQACREIYEDPCGFVEKNTGACLTIDEQNVPFIINQDLTLNTSGPIS